MTTQLVIAQNVTDAIRYSVIVPGGSARVLGAGNAFGAMGGDVGITSINVAGIGDFRASEITGSISYNIPSSTTRLGSTQIGSSNDGAQVLIENLALVIHTKPSYSEKFVTSNFAFSVQQYTNYNQVYSYEAESIGSITEYFAGQANFDGFYDFESELAFQSGAIFDDPDDNLGEFYFSDLLDEDITRKEQTIERSGSYNELQFSWGGKMKSGLSLGFGIGVPLISFEESKFYEENDIDGSPEGFNRLNFNESLTTSGYGINARAGIGYSLKNKFRIGLAYQSPTYLRLDDLFFTSMQYDCGDCLGTPLVESPTGTFGYGLRTPMKFTGSIGGLLQTDELKGFLNLDLQYQDYGANRFNLTRGDNPSQIDIDFEEQQNFTLQNDLASGLSYSLGGELAYKRYRVRAGFTAQLKPFANELGTDNIYGTGIGYRGNKFYTDLAFQYRSLREGYIPYEASIPERDLFLNNEVNLSKLVLTFGVKI